MTNKKDNFKARVNAKGLGLGAELSVGVPTDGMQNPSGDYPKRDYNFGPSINKAALGTKINKLYTGGGEIGVPLGITEQMPSQYPFNQVDETPSGHVIEMDDTPGGERILIRHRRGAGVELRADGSVVLSALKNKVEVTGGDHTVIVEGHGNLVYNGNLNLKVSGDYNVEVGGNYNIDVAGNRKERTKRNLNYEVSGDTVENYLGTRSQKVVGNNITMMLSDNAIVVKGDSKIAAEGNHLISTEGDCRISATNAEITATGTRIIGQEELTMQGTYGVIGGAFMRFTGQTYSGALKKRDYAGGDDYVTGAVNTADSDGSGTITGITAGVGSTVAGSSSTNADGNVTNFTGGADPASTEGYDTAIFHGSLHGVAKKAQLADNANKSITSFYSSICSVPYQGPPGSAPILSLGDLVSNFNLEAESEHQTVAPDNVGKIFTGDDDIDKTQIHFKGSPRFDVSVDAGDFIRSSIDHKVRYSGVFISEPTTQEIRSAFRNPDNIKLAGGRLVLEGKLPDNYLNTAPYRIGRVVGKEAKAKYGYTPIGNSLENRGKRFRK